MKKAVTLIYIFFLLFLSCKKESDNSGLLEVIAKYEISVSEPSGLAINNSGNILYTVSDNTNKVYKLSMQGALLQTFDFTGNDLEGICSYTDGKLLIAEERTKTIIELTIANNEVSNHAIDYDNNESNSGIEGVSFNPNAQHIYFLNEKDPGKLFVLSTSFSIINSYDLDFAGDYSGLFYDSSDEYLWIISDQSQTINKCTLTGELISSFSIGVNKPEGIVIANNKIYIVSDSEEKLYVFEKPE